MLPSFRMPMPSFGSIRDIRGRIPFPRRRPSRLTLAVAAATVATAATGITVAGVTAGGATPASAVSHISGISSPTSASAALRAGLPQTPQSASLAESGHSASGQQPAQHAASAPQAPAAHPAASPAAIPAAHPGATTPVAIPAARPAPAPPAQPYTIYDTTTPSAIPPGNTTAAVYATGDYAASPSQVAGRPVLWIDTTGTDYAAAALDVEPGNVTPAQAGAWAYNRLNENPNATAILYTFQDEWPQVQAAVAGLPSWMQSHIRWWIADPTGVPHIVPGSQATQWYWGPNYDISTALPGF
jgi:hypothetical protein